MVKIYRIMKQISNRQERVYLESCDKEYVRKEFNKLANKPNMKVRVRNWWIEHKVTGVQFSITIEKV